MADRQSPFASSLFPFIASNLAPHRNPVTCILAGLDRPLAVCTQTERIEGDIVVIRPGIEHWVEINGRAKVLYFDGLEFPLTTALAARVPREVATLAIDALASSSGAQDELRARFSRGQQRCPAAVARTINAIAQDPMTRMNQGELAERLRLGRTQAMRAFKAAAGMTFRAYTAHLTRTFRTAFGTTPTLATADRR
jgi:hypothetical protein